MKDKKIHGKTTQRSTARSQPEAAAGAGAVSIAPPAYGIDLLDHGAVQRQEAAPRKNETGLPDQLKEGVESLSGMGMDDVSVHYHSAKPAQLQAVAYTQGTDIHVETGQEQHLPHEAWHVVQQKQGRVQPTQQAYGVALNDDTDLEQEAEVMGTKALQMRGRSPVETGQAATAGASQLTQRETGTVQRFGEKERTAFLEKYPSAKDLVSGIDVDGTDTAILDALVQKYLQSGFMYTMGPVNPVAFLNGRRDGDCGTLSKSFVKIAKEYFNITNIKTKYESEPFGVRDGGLVLDVNGATGNVDGGRHWAFTSHTWVVGPDRDRDMLFRGATVDEDSWIYKSGEGKEEGIEYEEFADIGGGRVYEGQKMGGSLANRYTTDLRVALEAAKKDAAIIEAMKPKKKLCFITTACTRAKGLADDCEELVVLRAFRDSYLLQKPGGRQLVELYYQYSPDIVDVIAEQENIVSIYDQLYSVIRSCVEAIKKGDNEFAYTTYCEMVMRLQEQYIPDVAVPSFAL